MQRLDETAKGVCAILATPFAQDGALDTASIGTLVEYYLRHGSNAVTILGMMGEAQKLDAAENGAVITTTLSAMAGAGPVIVGASSPGVRLTADLAKFAMDQGCAGVMVAPLGGLRTDEQIFGYYANVIAAMGDVPLVIQDFPTATGVMMSAGLLGRLIDEFPQVVMIKHEDYPGLNKLSRLRADQANGRRRVSILVGNGALHLPQELARGADGAMSGFSYPEMMSGVVSRFAAGDADGAEDLFDCYLPLVRHEAQPGFGIAARKEILVRRGAIASNHVRQPGPKLTPADIVDLDRLIGRLERRLAALGFAA